MRPGSSCLRAVCCSVAILWEWRSLPPSTRTPCPGGFRKPQGFPAAGIAGWPTGVWLEIGGLSVALGIWPDIGALIIALFAAVAASYFHRYWVIEDEMQKMTQQQLFGRNMVIIASCLFMFATFAVLGEELRYAITSALFDF